MWVLKEDGLYVFYWRGHWGKHVLPELAHRAQVYPRGEKDISLGYILEQTAQVFALLDFHEQKLDFWLSFDFPNT
jgi:hypothetical protein